MLLFASILDNDEIPDKPAESRKHFMNSKIVLLAEQKVNYQLESRDLNEVSFSTGYATNLFMGVLLWASSDTPRNHSPFSFSKVEPIQAAEHKNNHLTFQLILTKRRGTTVEEIKGLNKQEVHAPMNFHMMHKQLLMLMIANDFIFSKFDMGSQSHEALMNTMNHHKLIFKLKECLNEEFPAKFLPAADLRFQIWLKECKSAKNLNKVDDTIINFAPLVNQVIFGSFHMELPPTFKMKSQEEPPALGPGGGGRR
jgi:hypothetical protein